jgi:hypothetical protein
MQSQKCSQLCSQQLQSKLVVLVVCHQYCTCLGLADYVPQPSSVELLLIAAGRRVKL